MRCGSQRCSVESVASGRSCTATEILMTRARARSGHCFETIRSSIAVSQRSTRRWGAHSNRIGPPSQGRSGERCAATFRRSTSTEAPPTLRLRTRATRRSVDLGAPARLEFGVADISRERHGLMRTSTKSPRSAGWPRDVPAAQRLKRIEPGPMAVVPCDLQGVCAMELRVSDAQRIWSTRPWPPFFSTLPKRATRRTRTPLS